jgi:hypothetical protein
MNRIQNGSDPQICQLEKSACRTGNWQVFHVLPNVNFPRAGSLGDKARVRPVRQTVPHGEDPVQPQATRSSERGKVSLQGVWQGFRLLLTGKFRYMPMSANN